MFDRIAAACTGASYLIELSARLELFKYAVAFWRLFITAALATVAALCAMNLKRVAILTPYPDF